MQAGGGDTDFRAHAELAAIGKARGGVDHDHGAARRGDEAFSFARILLAMSLVWSEV